jgi:hypothetical protein
MPGVCEQLPICRFKYEAEYCFDSAFTSKFELIDLQLEAAGIKYILCSAFLKKTSEMQF